MHACQNGDLETVKSLLSQGADIKATSKDWCTVQWHAVQGGNLEVLKYIVKAGNFDIKAVNGRGQGFIHAAALAPEWKENHEDIVDFLISEGCDIDMQDRNGHTALFDAVYKRNRIAVELLGKRGADMELSTNGLTDGTSFGISPLSCAVAKGEVDMVTLLLSLGANLHTHGRCLALQTAINSNNTDTIGFLLDNGACATTEQKKGCLALHNAARLRRKEILKVLLERGWEVELEERDEMGLTPLLAAVIGDQAECVEFLIGAGADLGARVGGNREIEDGDKVWSDRDFERLGIKW